MRRCERSGGCDENKTYERRPSLRKKTDTRISYNCLIWKIFARNDVPANEAMVTLEDAGKQKKSISKYLLSLGSVG